MTPNPNVNPVEQPAPKRSKGLTILLGSVAAGVLGIAPLALYIWLGPSDGNPIGLGLLAMLAVPVAIVGAVIGAVSIGMEYFRRTRR
jgi:hypothetical protein